MKPKFLLTVLSFSVSIITSAQVIRQLPAVNLIDQNNQSYSTSSISNFDNPTIVICYDDIWCTGCYGLLTKLDKLYTEKSISSGVKLVLVNMDDEMETADMVTDAAKSGWTHFQILHDANGEFQATLSDYSEIQLYFLDQNQNIVWCCEDASVSADSIYILATLIKQKKVTAGKLFFNEDWFPCEESSASFYRTVEKTANGHFDVTDLYLSGQRQMFAECSSINPEIFNGIIIYYYPTGTMETYGHFSNNRKSGEWRVWNKQFKLISIKNYLWGKEHGLWTTYFSNGQESNKGQYLNGEPDGLWFHYFDNGQTRRRTIWNNGQKISSVGFYDGVQEKYKILQFDEDNMPSLFYTSLFYENGTSALTLILDKDSIILEIEQYYATKEIKSVLKVSKGEAAGGNLFSEYYQNGNRKMSAVLNDSLHFDGLLLFWDVNGQKTLEINFVNNHATGEALAWFPSGVLKEKVNFSETQGNFYSEDGTSLNTSWNSQILKYRDAKGRADLLDQTVFFFNEFLDDDMKIEF